MSTILCEQFGLVVKSFIAESEAIGWECFSDSWEGTDEHKGGEVVTNPSPAHGSYKYFRPLNFTFADIPYNEAKEMLLADIYRAEMPIRVQAFKNDILVNTESVWFDHSPYDDQTIEERAKESLSDFDIETFLTDSLDCLAEKIKKLTT